MIQTPSPADVRLASNKFTVGDKLTDAEVKMLHKLYRDALKALDALHIPAYTLVTNDVYKNFNRLDEILTARKL